MKIKLTKRGRNLLGALGWLVVVIVSIFFAMLIVTIAEQSPYTNAIDYISCVQDSVRQADGSCTPQE